MASVVIAGDTSGTVTLAAPAVAGTTTLTLPTANGTVITTGSSASLPVSAINATGTPSATTYLRGDSTWATVSGGVTSAVAGNGIAVSGATGAVTFSAACPSFNSVGSYAFVLCNVNLNSGFTMTSGSNYGTGTSGSNLVTGSLQRNACGNLEEGTASNNLSGTWKWMAANNSQSVTNIRVYGMACRVS